MTQRQILGHSCFLIFGSSRPAVRDLCRELVRPKVIARGQEYVRFTNEAVNDCTYMGGRSCRFHKRRLMPTPHDVACTSKARINGPLRHEPSSTVAHVGYHSAL